MAVEQSKVNERYKLTFGSIGLSKTRLDAMTAKLAGKIKDDATDEEIDQELNDLNEIYPFAEIKKTDDRLLNEKNNPNKVKAEVKEENPNETAIEKSLRLITEKLELQEKRFTDLQASTTINSRKDNLIKSLNGVDKAKVEKVIKNFGRMNFETDEEFNEYLTETKEDFKAEIEKAKLSGYNGADAPNGSTDKSAQRGKVEQISAEDAKKIVGIK